MLYELFDKPSAGRPSRSRRRSRRRPRRRRLTGIVAVAIGVVALGVVVWMGGRWAGRFARRAEQIETVADAPEPAMPAQVWPLGRMGFPTPQTDLLNGDPEGMFMPTAAGRLESAFYGSTRRGRDGRPSFHEGVDIAPVRRDRSGRALDDVFAVADGRVAHVSPHPGNSNYGIYVVLFHSDEVGEIYTLYAHLASVADGLRVGRDVSAGAVLGRMGRTPARIVPVVRSHLHFEIGLIAHADFGAWLEARKIPSVHGIGHGWNLLGIDPMAVWTDQRRQGERFTLRTHLATLPIAFEWVVKSSRLPDFFRRYPALWEGSSAFAGPALVLAFSEGGVPLSGRPATESDVSRLNGAAAAVLTVDPVALGGNGRRLVEESRGQWRLSDRSSRWLDFFLFQ